MLGSLIRQRRHALDMKQQVLADKVGVTQSYISHLESGTKQINVTIDVLRRIADVLDIPVVDLAQAAAIGIAPRDAVSVSLPEPPLTEYRAVGWSESDLADLERDWPFYDEKIRTELTLAAQKLYTEHQDLERRAREQKQAVAALLNRHKPIVEPSTS